MATDSSADARTRVEPEDARSPIPDAAVIEDARPLDPLPVDPRCDAFDELALEANRVAGALVSTYERSGLVAAANNDRTSCGGADFDNVGDDVTIKFTAPRSGSWKFVAAGRGVTTLRVRRACALSNSCVGATSSMRGRDLDSSMQTELSLQQGETVELTVDGCPAGARCAVSIRAERWGRAVCYSGACPERTECSLESDDSPRFSCRPTVDLRQAQQIDVRSISAQVDAQSRHFLFDLELDPGAFWYLTVRVERWLLEDGSSVAAVPGNYTIFSTHVNQGRAAPALVALPDARYVGAEFSLIGDRATVRRTVRFDRWTRPAVGDRCTPGDLHTLCVAGARCDRESNTCVRAERLEIASATVFRNDVGAGFRGVIRGVIDTQNVTVRAAGLDERGVWREATYAGFIGGRRSIVTEFETTVQAALPEGRYSRARIVLADGVAQSAPVFVAINEPRVVGAGESCAETDTTCASGLACEYGPNSLRCEPPQRRDPCDLEHASWAARWSPSADESVSVIEGFGYGSRSQLPATSACIAGERWSFTPNDVVFVAPRAGRYRFEARGITELKTLSLCTQQDCQGATAWDSVLVVHRELREGQRFLFTFATFPRVGQFSLRAKRLED